MAGDEPIRRGAISPRRLRQGAPVRRRRRQQAQRVHLAGRDDHMRAHGLPCSGRRRLRSAPR
eukprot:2903556-Prymnesium_polylepis.1